MNMISRIFERIFFYGARTALIPFEFLRPRLYMKLYMRLLEQAGVHFTGAPRYISSRARFDDFDLVTIGERVVVSMYVHFLTHDYSLTTALIATGAPPATDVAMRRPIHIGNNVFIGMNVMILPGTTIGDNVIIGAGSVVRGNVEADSIMVGNPATRVSRLTDSPERWLARLRGPNVNFDRC